MYLYTHATHGKEDIHDEACSMKLNGSKTALACLERSVWKESKCDGVSAVRPLYSLLEDVLKFIREHIMHTRAFVRDDSTHYPTL